MITGTYSVRNRVERVRIHPASVRRRDDLRTGAEV